MTKIGLLFPGQGAQYVGMGKELYDNHPEAKEVFDTANTLIGFDLRKIVFEGPEDTLRQTNYTQPAIFVASLAAYSVLKAKLNIQDSACIAAGHSLGEYSAMAAAGIFSLKDGINLVKARGSFIQDASSKSSGTMAAIIGLDSSKIHEICKTAGPVCEAVNFNCPGQTVIAGTIEAVNKAVELANQAGATKSIVLNVSGPFHSSLMTPASIAMKGELAKYTFSAPRFPVVANCDAEISADTVSIKEKLVRQINSPVLWENTINRMIGSGVETFIEIGPGRVLSGLLRRIDKTKKSVNVEDLKSLEKVLETAAV
jgi:[acyl-carrier-protein] S-malonyltransferase